MTNLFKNIFDLENGGYNTFNVKALKKIKYEEVFDANKLAFILNNLKTIKLLYRPYAKDSCNLESYYIDSKVNSNSMGFKQVKYYQKDSNLKGRLQAEFARSGQGMVREVRHTIFNDFYTDFDIDCCHQVIINWICDNTNVECPKLKEFIKNRQSIIDELLILNPTHDKELLKKTFLSIANGGVNKFNKLPNKNQFIIDYKNEFEKIHESIGKQFKEIKKIVNTKNPDGYNILGKTMNNICCFVENQLLQHITSYFKSKLSNNDFNNCILCFDGIMVRKDLIDNKQTIKELEQLFLDIGIPIKMSVKAMNPIDLDIIGYDKNIKYKLESLKKVKITKVKKEKEPIEIINGTDLKLFDYNDNYYLIDFITDLIGEENDKIWKSYNELTNFAICNVNRVYIRLLNHNNTLFSKMDSEKPLEINKISSYKISFIGVDSEGDPKICKITFFKLLENEIYNDIKFYNDLYCKPYDMNDKDIKMPITKNFNTWSGFQAKLLNKEDIDITKIQFILDHWKTVLANGNDYHFKYQLTYFHLLFKYPEKKIKIFMLFKSLEHQIGKGSIFIEFIMKFIMGKGISYKTDNIESLTKRFNSHLMNKILFIADEIDTVNDQTHTIFNQIKGLITETMMEIEIKGGKLFNFENTLNGIGLTNKEWSIPLEGGDARYAIFDCDPVYQGNVEYFNKLHSSFNQENANIFFSYIYYLETDINIKEIPQTEIRNGLIKRNTNSSLRFIEDVQLFINNYQDVSYIEFNIESQTEIDEDDDEYYYNSEWEKSLSSNLVSHLKQENVYRIKGSELFNIFLEWCKCNNEKINVSHTLFTLNIKNKVNIYTNKFGKHLIFEKVRGDER